jgi:hypothetical protein
MSRPVGTKIVFPRYFFCRHDTLALGIEGLTLSGVVAEVFLAPGAGVEAIRGAEVGWNREAKRLKAKGLEIPSPYRYKIL